MRIIDLVKNHINFNKTRQYSCRVVNSKEVEISFRLSLPVWADDSKLITSENTRILYCRDVKQNRIPYMVDITNKDKGYPLVSNRKQFLYSKRYTLDDFINSNEYIMYDLYRDKNNVLREIKSNILLERIGKLTSKWDKITSGNDKEEPYFNYGVSRYESTGFVTGNHLGFGLLTPSVYAFPSTSSNTITTIK